MTTRPPLPRRDASVDVALTEIALCLAQAMHEIDPQSAQRINYAAGKAYNRLRSQGETKAADLVYAFGRMLLDPTLFPPAPEPHDPDGPA